ncbi:hypothetical protein GMD78_12305 [Ornithinibacillus sp. L9]|uniref:Minor capsid protein n=1 Tax=Ornithinibacillus caprae TaxID=2678566 RepID=A0A6N8FI74_9BACI|nr:minor capsid protein [Ornithinibacillus caprae]MUK89155.1 hypothetical protein [Ornithinibacillus caprae]
MIQEALMNQLKGVVPDLTWTIDYRTADDNTGTVYSTPGFPPDQYDTQYRYPSYQVYIRSSDWDFAKFAAEQTFQAFHNKINFVVSTEYEKDGEVVLTRKFHVFTIMASSEPIPVGVKDEIMEYSINFDVTLKEIKEDD